MTEFVLATYNIRNGRAFDGRNSWPLRKRNTLAVIHALNADVVCMQEVRPRQLAWLQAQMKEYEFRAVGRDDGASKGEHMVTALRRGFGLIVSSEPRWFSNTDDRPSRHPEALRNRFALVTKLRINGRVIAIANTHLDERSAPARRDAVERLANWYPSDAIVVGDFNCTIDDPALSPLFVAGFQDALAHLPASGPGVGTHHYFTGTTDETRIDHVLVAPGITITSAHVVHEQPKGALASDHWPVVANLKID